MKRITKVLALIALGGAIAVCIFGTHDVSSRRPYCIADVILRETPGIQLQGYPSPDGAWVANVYFKYDRTDILDRFWTFVRLERSDGSGRTNDRILTLVGSTSVNIQWQDSKSILVSYSGRFDGDFQKPAERFEDISIKYSKLEAAEPAATAQRL